MCPIYYYYYIPPSVYLILNPDPGKGKHIIMCVSKKGKDVHISGDSIRPLQCPETYDM